MSDRVLLQRKQAATPTNTNPVIASPALPTPVRAPSPQPVAAPLQAVTELSSKAAEVDASSNQQEKPDLQVQLERAKRKGHNFSRISVYPATAAVVQPKLTVGQANVITPLQRQALPGDEADVEPEPPVEAAKAQETVSEAEEVAPEPEASMSEASGTEAELPTAAADPQGMKPKVGGEDAAVEPPMEASEPPEAGEEVVQTKPALSQSSQNSSAETGDGIEQTLTRSKDGGSPLSDDVRAFMEPRFGADFSAVQVHTDGTAAQLNRKLQARAFTHGKDIFFNTGQYDPGSDPGKQLLAHELTHVIQQTGSISNKQVSRKPLETDQSQLQAKQLPTYSPLKDQEEPQESSSDLPKREIPTNENHAQPNHRSEDAAAIKGASVELVTEGAKAAKEGTTSPTKAAEFRAKGTKQPAAQDGVPQKLDRGESPLKQASPQSPTAAANSLFSGNLATLGSNTQPAPQTGGLTAPAASNVGASVSAAGASETAQEGATAGPSEEEIAAVAADTQGVELPSSDRSEVESALADVGSGGDAAATGGDLGGGGGGGTAIEEPPTPPVPDVSQAEPSSALASLSHLPPAQIQAELGGVTTAINSSIAQKQAELAANPPQMERPSGSAARRDGAAGDRSSPAAKTPKPVKKTLQKEAKSVPPPPPVKLPPAPIGRAATLPTVQGNPDGKVSEGDVQALKASINQMPTRDPGLNVTAGPPPALKLEGDADPNQANVQNANLEKSVAETHAEGRQDLAEPMGEHAIYPNVPKEVLKAEAVGGGKTGMSAESGVKVAGGNTKGGSEDDAISIIAQQQSGQDIQAAVAQARSQIATQRQEHAAKVSEEKAKSNQEISKIQQENADLQAKEREKSQAEVGKLRSDWNKEQTDLVGKSRKDADAAVAKGRQDVQQKQTQAETQATAHIEKGNRDVEAERRKGEEKAEAERRKADQEPKGVFGWLADKAKAFFDGIKQAIQTALEVARAAVKAVIETAQKLATEVIEVARKVIVAAIKAVGEALIAIGDVLLAAFPKLRDRFRNAIKAVVKAAEAVVNALADTLKKGVQAALNLLGKVLDAALKLLAKGYMLAVDLVNQAVQGAISAAKAVVSAVGAFAALIKDIAASPGQWLRNLATGVMDGIKNHLWTAFQTAVKEWFNQKLDEVLGLGMVVWQMLKQGGIGLAQVSQMAWEGIKAAIPPALIQILVEKLVSMIVPAAGTVMVIIEGLQAAWGTVSRILQAMERFMAFMKAVKTGNSGPQFGAMLAAAGVVLIDFVANWLLKKVRGAASKVGGKIKEIAKKIGQKLKSAAKKVGQKLKGGMQKVRDKFGKLKERFFGKKDKKSRDKDDRDRKENKEDKDRKNQEKLDKAIRELQPKVNALLQRGASNIRLSAQLAIWRIQYGLSSLSIDKQKKDHPQIIAKVNPQGLVAGGYTIPWDRVRFIVREVVEEILQREDVSQVSDWMAGKKMTEWRNEEGMLVGEEKVPPPGHQPMGTEGKPLEVAGGLGYLGLVKSDEERRSALQRGGNIPESHRWFYQFSAQGEATTEKQNDLAGRNAYMNFSPQTREREVYSEHLKKGTPKAPDRVKQLGAIAQSTGYSRQDLFQLIKEYLETEKWPVDNKLGQSQKEEIQKFVKETNEHLNKQRRVSTSYPGILKQIQFIMGDKNLDNEEFASSMHDFVKTGHLSQHLSNYSETVSSTTGLMFGREAMRNRMTLATAPMTLDLIASGKMTWEEAFTQYEDKDNQRIGGRGTFPMSMKGAQKAARVSELVDDLDTNSGSAKFKSSREKLEYLESKGKIEVEGKRPETRKKNLNMIEADVQELRARESQTIQRWCLAKLKLNNEIFDSEQSAETHVRDQIKKELSTFYGLT